MKSKLKKTEKGITLVALVVTIVVLLILAGVSINLVLGNNGIINKAKEASTKSAESSVKEKLDMTLLEYSMRSGSSLEDFLNAKIESGEIDSVTKQADGTFEVEKDGYIATINANGTLGDFAKAGPRPAVSGIKVVANANGSGENQPAKQTDEGTPLYITFTHSIEGGTTTVSPSIPFKVTANGTYKFTVTGTVNGEKSTKAVSVTVNQYSSKYKIGDYVNYTYDTAENYVLTSSTCGSSYNPTDGIPQTTGLKWRILNIDEANGTVDLISEYPTRTPVYFSNILGYNNGPYLMNEICKAQYSNKSLGVNARSINLLDMEKHLTAAGIAARNAYKRNNDTAKYGTTKTYTSYTKYPSLYARQKGAGVNVTEAEAKAKITQPNTDAGNDPYEESKAIAETEPTNDSTYGTGNPLTVTQTYYNISINETNYGDAYKVLRNSTWVAARCVDTNWGGDAGFGLRVAGTNTDDYNMFISNGNTDPRNYAYHLRPVVSLSSSLLTGEKTNNAWNLSK